jgi:hypothetical protein
MKQWAPWKAVRGYVAASEGKEEEGHMKKLRPRPTLAICSVI